MKAHQRIVREKAAQENDDLFGNWWQDIDVDIKKAEVKEVTHKQAKEIIEKY